MKTKQVKSKSRVKNYGEVYTASREIENMINLLPLEVLEPSHTFLEPACGNGKFLDAILKKKLIMLNIFHNSDSWDYIKNLLLIVGSLYGIDIQEDNVKETREVLYKTIDQYFFFGKHKTIDYSLENTIKEILNFNIINGNTLTGLDNNQSPIIVNEWAMVDKVLYRKEQYFNDTLLGKIDKHLNIKEYRIEL